MWYNLLLKNHNKFVILYRILIPPSIYSLIVGDIIKIAISRVQIRIDGTQFVVWRGCPRKHDQNDHLRVDVVFGDKKVYHMDRSMWRNGEIITHTRAHWVAPLSMLLGTVPNFHKCSSFSQNFTPFVPTPICVDMSLPICRTMFSVSFILHNLWLDWTIRLQCWQFSRSNES